VAAVASGSRPMASHQSTSQGCRRPSHIAKPISESGGKSRRSVCEPILHFYSH